MKAFDDYGRGEQFTIEGRITLFNYLDGITEDTGVPIKLDVIALCCEYAEYANIAEYNKDYGKPVASIEEIENLTTVIRIPDEEGFLILQY